MAAEIEFKSVLSFQMYSESAEEKSTPDQETK